MENTYKNLCKFPIYIKSIGKQIAQNATFECEDNDEMKDLVKQNKIANFGKDAINEETKPTKKGRKKKQPSESEDNSEQEDDETNTGGAF